MIKWGIIGAGNIAHRFATSLASFENAQLVAVANRKMAKAQSFQERHHAQMAFDNYQELLDLEELDMVYIALPHAYHAEWIKKSILAGKGILCEKPIVVHAAEFTAIQHLLEERPVFFMEAMKNRFTPAYQEMARLIQQGALGTLHQITTCLRRQMPEEQTSYHYLPEQGGCLLDMGIYNIALLTDFTQEKPQIEKLDVTLQKNTIETYVHATLQAGATTMVIESGFDQFKPAVATFIGTKGTLTMPDFHRPTSFQIDWVDGQQQQFELPYLKDDFTGEILHAMTCFSEGLFESPQMTWADSLRCAQWIDQLKEAIQQINS